MRLSARIAAGVVGLALVFDTTACTSSRRATPTPTVHVCTAAPSQPDPDGFDVNGVDVVKALANDRTVVCTTFSIVVIRDASSNVSCQAQAGKVALTMETRLPTWCADNRVVVALGFATPMAGAPPVAVRYTLGKAAALSLRNSKGNPVFGNPDAVACAAGFMAMADPNFTSDDLLTLKTYLTNRHDPLQPSAERGAAYETGGESIGGCA